MLTLSKIQKLQFLWFVVFVTFLPCCKIHTEISRKNAELFNIFKSPRLSRSSKTECRRVC